MTHFISTEDGYINLDRVSSINERALNTDLTKPRWERMQATVHWIDAEGNARASLAHSADVDPERLTAPVVPAAAGFYLIGVCEEPPHAIWRTPILAWRVLGDVACGWAHPVCLDELPPEPLAVLRPDGRVSVHGGADFESLDDYRYAELRRRERAAAGGGTDRSVPG